MAVPVVVSRSMSTSFTWAPVTLNPDGSTTCPETVAVSSCAKAEFAASETSNNRRQGFPTTRKERRSIGSYSSAEYAGCSQVFAQ